MKATRNSQTPREFISGLQKSVMEAREPAASLAALPRIFDRDLEIYLNGQKLGWPWLEQHMQELHTRLKDIEIEVTHAARDGNVLLERHLVRAVARDSGERWEAEIMAVYELTADDKIKVWRELGRIPDDYTGW